MSEAPAASPWRRLRHSLLLRLVTSRSMGNAFSARAASVPLMRLSKK